MPEEKEEQLPNYAFGAMDVMPLVELCNEIYEIMRQRPALQTPSTKKWMQKFTGFVTDHQYTKPLTNAIIRDSSEYKAMERAAIVSDVDRKMKDRL